MIRPMRRLLIPLFAALAIVAACSGSDDDTAAPEAETDYCQVILGIQGLGVGTNEEAVAFLRELRSVAPAEYEADLELLMATVIEMAREDPEGPPRLGVVVLEAGDQQQQLQEAFARLMGSAEKDCGFEPQGAPIEPESDDTTEDTDESHETTETTSDADEE